MDFITVLTNFGFPIALSIYLLARFEKILADLTKTNAELVNKNSLLIDEIADLRDLLVKKRK